jgi:hypothetical protein
MKSAMSDIPLPRMYRIEQEFSSPEIADVPSAVRAELYRLDLARTIHKGDTVAVSAGSRGIADISIVLKTTVEALRGTGAKPFIVPAMGSHGSGTAQGQAETLRRVGVTEETTGCPIRSSVETVKIGTTDLGFPLLLDRHAASADHIAVINRIKPHTRFTAPVESGLVKMCLLGLGKPEGARILHRAIDQHSWQDVYERAFPLFSAGTRLRFGLAIIENAHKKIAMVSAIEPGEFLTKEPKLLAQARSMMAFIPVSNIDLLIVDEMGKDLSGTGMDTNVTGRKEGLASISRFIFVRDLTDKSGGNALGIGLADFTTKRLVGKIDFNVLFTNALTAYRTDACKIPMSFGSDRDAIRTAAYMAGAHEPKTFRIVRIRNTLDLEQIYVSEAFIDEIKGNVCLKIMSGPSAINFDDAGNLIE